MQITRLSKRHSSPFTPHYPHDAEQTAGLVRAILILTVAVTVAGGLSGVAVGFVSIWHLLPSAIIIVSEMLVLLILNCGYVRTAAWLMITVLWLGLMVVSALLGGIQAGTVSMVTVVILIAGLTTGWLGSVLFTILTIVVLTGFYLFDVLGGSLPVILGENQTNIWIAAMVGVASTSIFLNLALKNIQQIMTTAQQTEHQLREALDELKSSTVSIEKLLESERRLRAVMQNAPVFIFAIDKDRTLTFFEGQGTHEKAIQEIGKILAHSLDGDQSANNPMNRAFQGENVKTTVIIPPFAFDIRYAPLFNDDHKVVQVIGVATDISERIQTEGALRASETRTRALVRALPDITLVFNRHGVLTESDFANFDKDKMDRCLFSDGNAVRDMPIALAMQENLMLAINECLDTGDLQTVEYAGEELNDPVCEARLARLNEDEVVMLVRDVTDSRRAQLEVRRQEQLYRLLARHLPDTAAMLYDNDLRYLLAEGDILQHFDLNREKLEGSRLPDVLAKQGQPLDPLTKAYRYGLKEPTSLDLTVGGRHYLLTTLPLHDESDQIYGGMAVLRDITDDRQREDAMIQFTEDLARSNHELEQFAYVASHDLQEPLRKIRAFSERLTTRLDDQLDPTSKDYLQRMENAAERMQTLINDLLSFSRVTTRAQPFQEVDLNIVLREVISDLEVRIEQTKALISVPYLPLIQAERYQIRQLLLNIIGNALKYNKHDVPPRIDISAEQTVDSDGGESVVIRISDNGIGFDEQYAERIFGVFQRLHTRREYQGTGMGLAICRKIVERHNGTLTATGVVDQGATFTIHLPITQKTRGTVLS